MVAADHVSRRLLASLGALAYGLALISFGAAHSLPVMLLAAFAWGAASDAFIHGCEVALVDLAGEDLPKALARMNAWASAGDLLGPLALAACALLGLGWRGAFLGSGVLMVGYAAWLASQDLPGPHPRDSRAPPLAGVLSALKDRRLLHLALVLGLFGLLDEPLDGFVIAYLERVRGLPPQLATAPVVAILIGGMAGYGGFERFGGGRRPRHVVLAAALLAAALPAVLFLPFLPLQVAAGFVFGAAGAVFYTTLQARILDLRPGQAGTASAVASLLGMAAMGFPALVGFTADAYGLGAGVGLYAAVPLVILALLALWRR